MFISVQFKNAKKEFVGKSYDFKLHKEEDAPAVGDIVRLMDEDYNYKFHATRMRVSDVKESSNEICDTVRYVKTTLDD